MGIALDYVVLIDSPKFKIVLLLQKNHVNRVEYILRGKLFWGIDYLKFKGVT